MVNMEAAISSIKGGTNDSTTTEQSQKLVDRIVYLASLASKREDVDPMLDTLRIITADVNDGPMAEADRKALEDLEVKLKTYLINSDPLRTFTRESLERRLSDQAASKSAPSGKNRLHLVVVLGGSLLAAVLTLVLLPASVDISNRLLIAVQPSYVILCMGTIWFYLTALKNFRPELKRAFVFMCLSVVFMAINFSADALVTLLEIGELPPFKYGGPLWTVTLSFIFMYLGLRIYARLLGIKGVFTSPWSATGASVALTTVAVLIPHSPKVTDEAFFYLSLVSTTVFLTLLVFGAILAKAIANNVTAAFTRSMKLICIYLLVCIPGTVVGLTALIISGPVYGRGLNLILATAGISPLLLLFYTGYSFKKETGK